MSYLLDILWVLPRNYLCKRRIRDVKVTEITYLLQRFSYAAGTRIRHCAPYITNDTSLQWYMETSPTFIAGRTGGKEGCPHLNWGRLNVTLHCYSLTNLRWSNAIPFKNLIMTACVPLLSFYVHREESFCVSYRRYMTFLQPMQTLFTHVGLSAPPQDA